jgi:hypothetical protein
MKRFYEFVIVFALIVLAANGILAILPAQPSVSQSYGLTLERDDFPFAAPVAGSPTVFQTAASTRSNFAIVFRNGALQRPCGVPTGPCDYTPTGNVIVTFPAGIIQAGDLVTVFFYR